MSSSSTAESPTDELELSCEADNGSAPAPLDLTRQRSQSDERLEKKGNLLKWTNYIQGWQERYVVLSNGTLSYYKSEFDTTFGCRGSMSLLMAKVQAHEFDDQRFDVSVTDCIYYLRCATTTEREEWLAAIQLAKEKVQQDHGYSSEVQSINSPLTLGRGNSILSLNSLMSNSSTTSKPSSAARLREKVLEMETFRDLLQHQMDSLQQVFDDCVGANASSLAAVSESLTTAASEPLEEEDDAEEDEDDFCDDDEGKAMLLRKPVPAVLKKSSAKNKSRHASMPTITQCTNFDHRCCDISRRLAQQNGDLRSELITFRATMTGLLSTLSICSDLIHRKDERLQRMLDHERDRRHRVEMAYHDCQEKLHDVQEKYRHQAAKGGPDFQEGPHCVIPEDEFLDALEGELERMDQEEEESDQGQSPNLTDETSQLQGYLEMLDTKLEENVHYCYEEVSNLWSVALEDGDLKVYRRDLEEGGVVVDPLKAYHTVAGITAYELCSVFFNDECRMDWETTVESINVLDRYGSDTIVAHQLHKRIWPSSQREIVFLSALRQLPQHSVDEKGFGYCACNFSVEHPAVPSGKFVRALINVALIAHTFVTDVEDDQPIERKNLSCKITYSANVNPGGWAPPSVVRALSKREYPKVLRRLCTFAASRVENDPIIFESPDASNPDVA